MKARVSGQDRRWATGRGSAGGLAFTPNLSGNSALL